MAAHDVRIEMAPKGRILVVDDDQAICTVVGEALRRSGHKVKAAGTIAERRQLLRSFAPDILITAVKLPDGDGLDDVEPRSEESRDGKGCGSPCKSRGEPFLLKQNKKK